MTTLDRSRRKKFYEFKKLVAKLIGSREEFKKKFDNEQRAAIYDALLFELNIPGGNSNEQLLNKFKSSCNNFDIELLKVA